MVFGQFMSNVNLDSLFFVRLVKSVNIYFSKNYKERGEEMDVKKKFKLVEDLEEEEFLNHYSKEGYILKSYDGITYHFEVDDRLVYYLVEFYFKELSTFEIRNYEKRGFHLVAIFTLESNGYYYYFVSDRKIMDSDRNVKDRHQKLLNSKTRVDRFSSIILMSSFLLFSYQYFKTYNRAYIVVLLFIVILTAYYGYFYIETIKKLRYYFEIIETREGMDDHGNDERCSEEG